MDDEKKETPQIESQMEIKAQAEREARIDTERRNTTSLIEEANRAAARIEKANTEQRQILAEQEMLIAQQRLGGKADAGQLPVIIKDDDPKEYAKKLFHGQIPIS